MSPRGPIVIDWNNARIGNPLEDVARSALNLSGLPTTQPSTQSLVEEFHQATLDTTSSFGLAIKSSWLPGSP
jgi:aminoglycoside phosphotransferase (APT) family kinase protein